MLLWTKKKAVDDTIASANSYWKLEAESLIQDTPASEGIADYEGVR
jgi:hypothetical protein